MKGEAPGHVHQPHRSRQSSKESDDSGLPDLHAPRARVGWAMTYLNQAGLVTRPTRGQITITDEGRAALRAHPERIDNKVLEAFPPSSSSPNASARGQAPPLRRARHRRHPARQVSPSPRRPKNPSDLVAEAVAANRAVIEGEVLKAALALSPTAFEELVIRLLGAMGYGRSDNRMGQLERTSASGDAGIDGIISQDPLGLDRIYVQAKHCAVDRPIGRPRIHEFAGALHGKQGDRGAYITTSRFTDGARTEADRFSARIELIDARRLAQLLVTHGVGVQAEQTVTLYRLDENFLETL